jgi:hypothetical protein
MNENTFGLSLLNLLSMVDFKQICSFSALLKLITKNGVLFLLISKQIETWLISKAFVVHMCIFKNHIRIRGS